MRWELTICGCLNRKMLYTLLFAVNSQMAKFKGNSFMHWSLLWLRKGLFAPSLQNFHSMHRSLLANVASDSNDQIIQENITHVGYTRKTMTNIVKQRLQRHQSKLRDQKPKRPHTVQKVVRIFTGRSLLSSLFVDSDVEIFRFSSRHPRPVSALRCLHRLPSSTLDPSRNSNTCSI